MVTLTCSNYPALDLRLSDGRVKFAGGRAEVKSKAAANRLVKFGEERGYNIQIAEDESAPEGEPEAETASTDDTDADEPESDVEADEDNE